MPKESSSKLIKPSKQEKEKIPIEEKKEIVEIEKSKSSPSSSSLSYVGPCATSSGSDNGNGSNDLCNCSIYQSPIALSNRNKDGDNCIKNVIFEAKSIFNQPLCPITKYEYDTKLVQWFVNNEVKINNNNQEYRLVEFHFHQSGEHTLNGQRYPLELHFVFLDKNDNIFVVGYLAELHDKLTSKVIRRILKHRAFEIPQLANYFTYPGSLTTPPFTKIVTWNVSQKVLVISKEDLKSLKSMSKGSRPLQDREGRNIVYATTKCK
jgi:carbonic anhydrase